MFWRRLNFYPRSPCGERQSASRCQSRTGLFLSTLSLRRATIISIVLSIQPTKFLSTLSLRRATHYDNYNLHCVEISIHALLAESDVLGLLGWLRTLISIHALLAESDTARRRVQGHHTISIHALLAESDISDAPSSAPYAISIHALLAESDFLFHRHTVRLGNFYPRSPCGERLRLYRFSLVFARISIHALLAESDHLCK